MAVKLKNYTSETLPSVSMGKIESCLVEAGATDINKRYSDGICTSITFRLMIKEHPVFFKLPARVDACFDVLWKEVKKPQSDTKQRIKKQAERTAWKIISDWVEVQLSMIRLEQADSLQIFLPYAYNPDTDTTFYDRVKDSGFKALLPPNK